MRNGGPGLGRQTPAPRPVVPGPHARIGPVLARWVLLAVVLAGVFALHVLTVEHGDHGDLPSAVITAGAAVNPAAAVALDQSPDTAAQAAGAVRAADPAVPTLPADTGAGWLAGCGWFLAVAGAAALLLATARLRRGDPPTAAGDGWTAGRHRPPGTKPLRPVPRLVLCVDRV